MEREKERDDDDDDDITSARISVESVRLNLFSTPSAVFGQVMV